MKHTTSFLNFIFLASDNIHPYHDRESTPSRTNASVVSLTTIGSKGCWKNIDFFFWRLNWRSDPTSLTSPLDEKGKFTAASSITNDRKYNHIEGATDSVALWRGLYMPHSFDLFRKSMPSSKIMMHLLEIRYEPETRIKT